MPALVGTRSSDTPPSNVERGATPSRHMTCFCEASDCLDDVDERGSRGIPELASLMQTVAELGETVLWCCTSLVGFTQRG